MDITIDEKDPTGACYKIGRYKVERKDYGRVVKQVGRWKKTRIVVYRELLGVVIKGEPIAEMVDVDEMEANYSPSGPAVIRMREAMKALKRLRTKIERFLSRN